MKTRSAVLIACSVPIVALSLWLLPSLHAEPEPGAAPPPPPAPAAAPPASAASTASVSDKVTITINVIPSVNATVSWGKQRLGVIKPHSVLTVQRPRDSGPLDVMIRATGYLPVQTRAFTFGDNKLSVRLTPLDQKPTLLGYREDLDAGPDGTMFIIPYDTDAGAFWSDY
jgi:hypothetical protein